MSNAALKKESDNTHQMSNEIIFINIHSVNIIKNNFNFRNI